MILVFDFCLVNVVELKWSDLDEIVPKIKAEIKNHARNQLRNDFLHLFTIEIGLVESVHICILSSKLRNCK